MSLAGRQNEWTSGRAVHSNLARRAWASLLLFASPNEKCRQIQLVIVWLHSYLWFFSFSKSLLRYSHRRQHNSRCPFKCNNDKNNNKNTNKNTHTHTHKEEKEREEYCHKECIIAVFSLLLEKLFLIHNIYRIYTHTIYIYIYI